MPASLQLRQYIELRADLSREEAAERAGIGIEEARLTDIANDRGEIEFVPLNHNQPKEPVMAEGNVAADELRLLIERVERLEEEKKAISDDIKDVYAEAKARGYDTKTMREMVKLRKMEPQARAERDALIETYRAALGIDFSETPLGAAAVGRASESLEDLAHKILANGGQVVNGSLVMPMTDAARAAAGVKPDEDLYPKARQIVVSTGKASVSYLQRQLGIGYNAAAGLMEQLERDGVVSAPDTDGKRKVIATAKSVMEKVAEQVNAGALGPGVTATFHPAH